MQPGNVVTINTDTAYDAEGVPNGVVPGSKGIIREVKSGWVQVECDTLVGRQVVGVRPKDLKEAVDAQQSI